MPGGILLQESTGGDWKDEVRDKIKRGKKIDLMPSICIHPASSSERHVSCQAAGFYVIPVTEFEWNEAVGRGVSDAQYLWGLLTHHGFKLREPPLNGQESERVTHSVAAVDPGAWVDSYQDGLQDDTTHADAL